MDRLEYNNVKNNSLDSKQNGEVLLTHRSSMSKPHRSKQPFQLGLHVEHIFRQHWKQICAVIKAKLSPSQH